tara:strand:+ start:753 stop:1001 length:249 start_codon:yes stop_codon:yes gene_type:complete
MPDSPRQDLDATRGFSRIISKVRDGIQKNRSIPDILEDRNGVRGVVAFQQNVPDERTVCFAQFSTCTIDFSCGSGRSTIAGP